MGFDASRPHLSRLGDLPETAPEPGERYTELGLLGVGGMGEVRAVWDARLGRQVARKTARIDVPGAAEALRHEGAVTAALEHPGVVPVYDSGTDSEGRPWYTMRRIDGRSLRAVLDATPAGEARLALLPACLTAARAVAFAHARGVLHRDLKPGNVMLGELGEALVVDWGLAGSSGGGTPAYMAPELHRGEPATPRSDVWALGRVLEEVVEGGGPADLRAVIARCTEPEPEHRYADAGELASELERHLDGRPVQAHRYTLAERTWRFVDRRRGTVTATLLALLAVAGVSVIAAIHAAGERDLARAAALSAEQARARADRHLAQAWVLAARNAADRGARAEAEVLAAHALGLAEDPDARGVLIAQANARPARTADPLPACDGRWRAAGDVLLCLGRDALVAHLPDGRTWSAEPAQDIAPWIGGDRVVASRAVRRVELHDLRTGEVIARAGPVDAHALVAGAGRVWAVAGRDGVELAGDAFQPVRAALCEGGVVLAAVEPAPGRLVVACEDGTLRERVGSDGQVLFARDPENVTRLAASADGALAWGTARGRVGLLRDGVARTFQVPGAVEGLTWTGDGSRLVVTARGAGHLVLHGATGVSLGRLPLASGALLGAVGPSAVRTTGRGGERWELAGLTAARVGEGSGITGLAPGGDGTLTVSRGAGDLVRYDVGSGAVFGQVRLASRVLKGVVRLPDGYAAVGVEGGLIHLASDLSDPRRIGPDGRRVARLGPDLLVAGYSAPTRRVSANGADSPLDVPVGWVDLGGSPEAGWVAALGEDGSVWRVDASGGVTQLAEGPSARSAVDVTRDGRVLAVGPSQAELWHPDGRVERFTRIGAELTDLAISPDDRWVALGGVDGVLRVHALEDLALTASFAGHTERIAALAFDPDGVLWSAGWDETARAWDLSTLDRSAPELLTALDAAWGLGIPEALRAAAPG